MPILRKTASFIWWVLKLGGVPGAVREIYQALVYLAAYGPALLVASVLSTVLDFATQMPFPIRLAFFGGVFLSTLAIAGTLLAVGIRYFPTRKESKPNEEAPPATQLTHWENRVLLKRALTESYENGLLLRRGKSSEKENREWAARIYALVGSALNEGEPLLFLFRIAEDEEILTAPDLTKETIFLDGHLNHLSELIRKVDSLEPLELRPDFDGREWVSRR